MLALTRAMPENWLGLRLAILFRRLIVGRIGEGCRDTTLWGMRLRLYPRRNGCEKNALFTPQMFDTMERRVLAEAVRRKRGGAFTFVDIGANVGLYSLYLALVRATCARSRSSRSPEFWNGCASILRQTLRRKWMCCRLRSPIARAR